MERGRLRVYLAAAAGAGTTYAMLDEATRRMERGSNVLVACVDTHGRPRTLDLLRRLVNDPASLAPTLDVEATLAAVAAERPSVVFVDDLAARGASGRPHWRDVEQLLQAGVDVVSTLTVQHIESLADPVRAIVGHAPAVSVPDDFLRRAEQIELVDITPEAIRRRIAHGNVFTPDALRATEAEVYNTAAFGELRALLLFWLADRLSAGPGDLRDARETVVVAVTDSPTSDVVLRRAARLAHRSRARLVGVHVAARRAAAAADTALQRQQRRERVEALGGVMHEIVGDRVAEALVAFADGENATQLVLGGRVDRRRWWRPSIVDEVLDRSHRRDGAPSSVDVHVVSTDDPPRRPSVRWIGQVPFVRQIVGAVIGAVVLVALTAVLVGQREDLSVSTSLALYLLLVVGVAAVGGAVPGLTAAVVSPLVANWFLIPPYHTFRVNDGENLLELFVFVSVAAIVSAYVSVSARRSAEARRAQREAATLAALTGSGDLEQPTTIVDQICSTFGFDGVSVLSATTSDGWRVVAATGDAPLGRDDADFVSPLGAGTVVAARGGALDPDDHRVLRSFGAQLARAFEQQRLRSVAAEAEALARTDELRTALLRAVSHDLRSPLASIKASVSSIRQPDVEWPPDVLDDFLESIESETDRLTSIVTNLLDLSRLEAGVLRPAMRRASLEEVVPTAVRSVDADARVDIDLPSDLPEVWTDPALLERVVANLVANALRFSPAGVRVRVSGHPVGDRVQIHVVDHGPGIAAGQRKVVVQPFHRLDDSGTGGGLGLGLAIVDRLLAATGGNLDLRDTPGGGLTAVVALAPSEEEP